MKKLLYIGVAMLAFVNIADATTQADRDLENYAILHECGITAQSPAPLKNELPIYKISVWLEWTPLGGKSQQFAKLSVIHHSVNGDQFARNTQYNNQFSRTNQEYTWTGYRIKDPSYVMTGTYNKIGSLGTYTEKGYKSGKLIYSMISHCHEVKIDHE